MTRLEPVLRRESREADRLAVELEVPADLRGFQGHFPGRPILPGVLQLGWAVRFAADLAGPGAECTGIRQLKFKSVVVPGTVLGLEVRREPGDRGYSFRFRSDAGEHSSGLLLFRCP